MKLETTTVSRPEATAEVVGINILCGRRRVGARGRSTPGPIPRTAAPSITPTPTQDRQIVLVKMIQLIIRARKSPEATLRDIPAVRRVHLA